MIQFQTLGSLDLSRSDGTEVRSVLAQPKRLALFDLSCPGQAARISATGSLVAMFWPDSNAERARAALNRSIYFLRRTLGDDVIVSRGDEELAIDAARISSDAASFVDLIEHGNPRQALELYRGELLPGFFVSDATGFEEWLESERAYLRDRACQAAWALVASAGVDLRRPRTGRDVASSSRRLVNRSCVVF